jgi:hypothetical protein
MAKSCTNDWMSVALVHGIWQQVPQQANSRDCRLFVLHYSDVIIANYETFQHAIIRDNTPITVGWRTSELGKLQRRYELVSWRRRKRLRVMRSHICERNTVRTKRTKHPKRVKCIHRYSSRVSRLRCWVHIHSLEKHHPSRHFSTQYPFILQFGYQNLRLWFRRTAGRGRSSIGRVSIQLWTSVAGLGEIIPVRFLHRGFVLWDYFGKSSIRRIESAEVVVRYKQQNFPSLDEIATGYATLINNCWHDNYSSIKELGVEFPPLPLI